MTDTKLNEMSDPELKEWCLQAAISLGVPIPEVVPTAKKLYEEVKQFLKGE